MKTNVLITGLVALFFAWCLMPGCAAAQEKPYPTRQITYMVCFDPGGQSDREARRHQPYLDKILKQKVIIDYKVGGGGALGWRELEPGETRRLHRRRLQRAPHHPSAHPAGSRLQDGADHPRRHLSEDAAGPHGARDERHQDLPGVHRPRRKNPGKVTIGGSGTFSGYHMATLRLEKLSGAKFTYVPFTGTAPQVTAFLGGHVDAIMGTSDDLTRYKDKVRVLAFATSMRFPGFTDAPTFRELKVDLVEAVDRGVAVPPKTPAYIIKKLETAFLEIATKPEIMAEMRSQGFQPVAMGHDESVAYITRMTGIYKELTAGLKK